MPARFDAVIGGGGLAGRSLAAHLATRGWHDRSVLVVDDPGAYRVERWGFWSARPGLLGPYARPRIRWRHRMLDTILLRAIDRDPALLEVVFDRLFSRNPPERVLRFLDEQTSISDELRLIAGLPVRPFLRGLLPR